MIWLGGAGVGWVLFFQAREAAREERARAERYEGLLSRVHAAGSKAPAVETAALGPTERARLVADLRHLGAGPRFTEPARAAVRGWLLARLTELGYAAEAQPFPGGVNVVALKPGTDPTAGAILLGAHYDTVEESPGLDDNASGVAAALEVARLLAEQPSRRGLRVVFFDLEERGYVGSQAYVQRAENLDDLKAAVVLEMVGYTCHRPGCQRYPAGLPLPAPPAVGEFLAVVGNDRAPWLLAAFARAPGPERPPVVVLPVPDAGRDLPDTRRSDHAPFWDAGLPAVMLTDTGDLRNPHYHLSSDGLDQLDLDFLEGNVRLVSEAVAWLLEADLE